MYFLTLQDPNYIVKGSRDPLGFQVLWQNAGRELIPYLSTVSNNIRDYQVMALAEYCRQTFRIDERDYLPFFLCFEQLMAYTRFTESKGNDSFNGIDKVRRIMSGNDRELSISLNSRDQLLSNQKSYGVWGKYNRPFSDMGLAGDKRFLEVQAEKLETDKDLRRIIEKLIAKKGAVSSLSKDILDSLGFIFAEPKATERDCYIQYLLSDNTHGELLRLTNDYPELLTLSFYQQLDFLEQHTKDVAFGRQVSLLRNTERVLSPLNRIFRYLQDRSYWDLPTIAGDELIASWSKTAPLNGAAYVSPELSHLLQLNNIELVSGLAEVNRQVCLRRGSEPWLAPVPGGVEVNHFEGAFTDDEYHPGIDNDYNYFLNSWFHLYRQLN